MTARVRRERRLAASAAVSTHASPTSQSTGVASTVSTASSTERQT